MNKLYKYLENVGFRDIKDPEKIIEKIEDAIFKKFLTRFNNLKIK